MRLDEPTAALRRILLTIYVEDGSALATDAAVGLAAGDVQITANGAAFANAGGTLTHIGDGLYFYEATLPEAGVQGFLGVKYERAGYAIAFAWTSVGEHFAPGETDTTLLRVPFLIFDESNQLATGATAAGAELQVSSDGGAFADAGGTLLELSDGAYYYQGVVPDAAVEGWLSIKYEKAGFGTQHAWVAVASIGAAAPIISNVTPAAGIDAGEPGALSSSYSVARATPVEFDLDGLAEGAGVAIWIKFQNRNETYMILNTNDVPEQQWKWPFDASSTIGDITELPVHVSLLPRDGWPPIPWSIKVAAIKMAEEA